MQAASPEWPGWAGPSRDFHLTARSIATTWPAAGPKVLWKHALPYGSSSIAVEGKRLYTMYRDGDNEVVLALDATNGKTVWEYKYAAKFLKGMNMATGPGPHSTPMIDGPRLFTVGVNGKLHCLDKKTGKYVEESGVWDENGKII